MLHQKRITSFDNQACKHIIRLKYLYKIFFKIKLTSNIFSFSHLFRIFTFKIILLWPRMFNEKVCFEYIWRISRFLGILREGLSLRQKLQTLLIFLFLYVANLALTLYTVLTSKNQNEHKTGLEFLPFTFGKITELVYFIIKSKEVYTFTENWKVIMQNTQNIKYFIQGSKSSMKITKYLFMYAMFGIFVHALGVLITRKTLIPLKITDDYQSAFLIIWIYQSSYQAYGAIVFFIFDIFIFHNFFMLRSYMKTTSSMLEHFPLRRGHETYFRYLR